MKKHTIQVDAEMCIGCGLCVSDCPVSDIAIIKQKAVVKATNCIYCGHCVAICPKNAICMSGFKEYPKNIDKKTVLNPQLLMESIRTRRSIRHFKDHSIDPEIIAQIIKAGRLSPTAKNAQDVSYIVLENNKEEYEKIAVSFLKNIKKFFMSIRKKLTGFKEFVVKVKEIVTDTKNQYAVRRLWEELLYLLKHFGFRKIHTELTFALADPAFTGQVLGVLCMMPFLYQYDFHIFPDFESESFYIRGSYDVKGRIQLIFLLVTAIRLLADKDIRSFLKKLLDHRE